MKTVVFYFSGTGNSLAAARKIANALNDSKVVSMLAPEALSIARTVDRVGFVFPVYIFTVPMVVEKFLRSVELPANAPIFAVATCGGRGLGSVGVVKSILRSRGFQLSVGFDLPMVNNYIPLGIPGEAGQKTKLEGADSKLEKIIDRIKSGEKEIHGDFFIKRWISASILSMFFKKIGPSMDKKFSAGSDCNGCGVCARVCPAENINVTNSRPEWQHRCEQCWACVNWCPQKTIQYGKSTVGKPRYHHPEVKLNEMVSKND